MEGCEPTLGVTFPSLLSLPVPSLRSRPLKSSSEVWESAERSISEVRGSGVYLGECYCITVPPCPDIICGNGVPSQKYLGTAFPAFPSTTPLLDPHLMHPSLERSHAPPQTTAHSVHVLSHNYPTNSPLVTVGCPTFTCKTAPSLLTITTLSNTPIPRPTPLTTSNGIWITRRTEGRVGRLLQTGIYL